MAAMGFGKSNAFVDEDQDDAPPEEVVRPFAQPDPSEAIEFGAPPVAAAAEDVIQFAPSSVPSPDNDEGGAVLRLTDSPDAPWTESLGEALAQRSEETLPAAGLAPALPPSAPRVQRPPQGAAAETPAAPAAKSDAPAQDGAPAAPSPAQQPEPEDLGLSPDQMRLFESLGEDEKAEIKHHLRSERDRLEADRRRLEMERKRMEAAPPVGGLAMLAHAMFRPRNTLERRERDFRTREAFLQTGYVGENYFRLKQRDFLRTAGEVAARQAALSNAVNSYNAAFGATEPGRRYLDKVDRLIAGGMHRDAAQAFVREGNVVGAKEDAAEALKDPRVAASKAAMNETTTQLEATARKFGADYELLQKNFPDKLSHNGADEVVKAFDKIAKQTPKPVAEPGVEADQTMEKRLARMAEGIKALVEAISRMIQSVFQPKG